MKTCMVFAILFGLAQRTNADDVKPRDGVPPARHTGGVKNEVVMSPGMRITATSPIGTIAITALDEFTRAYTWEGATRSVELTPRKERWHGSLGIYNPGAGEYWAEHHGITRGLLEEGQQHFKTVEEAITWIKSRDWMAYVHRDDGLTVGWVKRLPTKALTVEVWQLLVDGKKPERLPGSQNDKIVVETVETETIPLVKAVATDAFNVVTALLANGANPNVKNSVEIPVLVIAIRRGSVPIVEALLKRGADPNVRNVDNDTTPLIEALNKLDPNLVELLLAANADVNAASRKEGSYLQGVTPLMMMTVVGDKQLVQLLLEKGANVNAKSADGSTALMWAAMDGDEDVVQLLLQKGADLSASSRDGRTALSEAKEGNHQGVIRMLEKAGAKK